MLAPARPEDPAERAPEGCFALFGFHGVRCIQKRMHVSPIHFEAVVGFISIPFEGGRKSGRARGCLLESRVDVISDATRQGQLG
jgi:hypothetical protein